MTYCSLEEAWGSDFNSSNYYSKINETQAAVPAALASSTQKSQIPETLNPPENLRTPLSKIDNNPDLDKYFPSYNGGNPLKNTMKSNNVPYQVSFPDKSKRNYIYPVEGDSDNDNDSALDLLEDNNNDIQHIDRQRKIPVTDRSYMTSNDYFLYKKYMNLAEKYKQKLKKRYNLFMENENIEENFDNIQRQNQGQNNQNLSSSIYSMKDIIIIIIIGIFIILALDVFVKMGARVKQ